MYSGFTILMFKNKIKRKFESLDEQIEDSDRQISILNARIAEIEEHVKLLKTLADVDLKQSKTGEIDLSYITEELAKF